MKAAEMIGKAKAALILSQPFFASIICNLPVIEDKSIPTMATNGRRVKYNADFVESLTLDEVKFVLCHEVGHCMFQHMFRRGQRNPRRWNMAGDYVINDLLDREKVGVMPKVGLLNAQLVQAGGGTTEGVYDLIPESEDGQDGHSGLDACDDVGTGAEGSASEAEMKVMIAQAAQAAKMCGKLSANVERFVKAALKSQVNWKEVLRRFVSIKAKTELTYARPKRRFVSEDLYLPSLTGESMGPLVIAVDCSGSIGETELNEFATEIAAIKQDCVPASMHIVYFDSEVCHYDVFDKDEDVVIKPHGGGGTAFSPIFKFVDEKFVEPCACVVLTDLFCSDFGDVPGYPVLWVTTAATEAPWGEVVEMKPKSGA